MKRRRATKRVLKRHYVETGVLASLAAIPPDAKMRRENNRRVYFFGNRKFVETMPQSGVFKVLKKQF